MTHYAPIPCSPRSSGCLTPKTMRPRWRAGLRGTMLLQVRPKWRWTATPDTRASDASKPGEGAKL